MNSTRSFPQAAPSSLPEVFGIGGAIAGLGGGVAMAIVGASFSLLMGNDVWLEAKQVASVVLGQGAILESGFVAAPVIIGTLIHLVVAMLLGVLYGIVARRVLHVPSDLGVPALVGLFYGMLIWLATYFVVLPQIAPGLREMYAPVLIIQQIAYGTVTCMLYAYLRPTPSFGFVNHDW